MPLLTPLTNQIARLANRNVPALPPTNAESKRLKDVLRNSAPHANNSPADSFTLSGNGNVLTKRLGLEVPVQSVFVVQKKHSGSSHFSFELIASEPNRVTVEETQILTSGLGGRKQKWVIDDTDQTFHKLVQAKYTRIQSEFDRTYGSGQSTSPQ
jgi:hypothetical protein